MSEPGSGGRRILHADLDAFYASVEQRDAPDLRGIPMAVGGGVILAASYEARRLGVRTAMNARQARALCPHLRIVEPRMSAYAEASAAVFEIFRDTSPNVEALSIDEAFIDVTGLRRLAGTDVDIAARLRARVRTEVGLAISVGGGSTKFLAKVASAVSKPDGLLIVAAGEELSFLRPLPVGRLWGVGPVAEERLAAVGIHTVGQVAELDREFLRARLGRAWGEHLHALAHNRDPRPVEVGRRRRSVGSQRSFPRGTVDRQAAEQIVVEVSDRICRRLRSGHRIAATVTLRLRYGDFSQATRSRTLAEPSCSTDAVLSTAKRLLARAWPEIEGRGLTRIGVAVSGLTSDDAVQLPLPFSKAELGSIDGAVDEIRDRFGIAAVTRATLVGRSPMEMPLLPD
ncbi:MAG: DNA polymerase IV [Acidimicrobiales bacterium]